MRIILSILLLSFCYSQDCGELSLPNCNTSGDGMPCCAYALVDDNICHGPDMYYGCDLSCYEEEAGPDWSYDCLCPDSCDDPNDGTWCGTWTDDCGTAHSCGDNCEPETICQSNHCVPCIPVDCGNACGEFYDECAQGDVDCGECGDYQQCEGNWCYACNDHIEDCCDGFIPNCNPTYNNPLGLTTKICCDEDWIGDDFCDGITQYRGCDLTCYDEGGSDCGDSFGDCSDAGDCSCCETSESGNPYCEAVYTSTGCDLWADTGSDGIADDWVDNCLVCSQCEHTYNYTQTGGMCCDELFWNSNGWLDPCDDTSPRLTCNLIATLGLGFDCTGCACPGDTFGCTDSVACNYNSYSTIDDGSCTYTAQYYDCNGICINDSDGDTVCDELEVVGCQDETACNYDETATDSCSDDDGNNIPDCCTYTDGICETCLDGVIVDNDADDDTVCDELDVCEDYDDTVDSDGDGTPDGCDLSLYEGIIPDNYSIASIYPNPFNPITNITYGLPEHVNAQIVVYDLSGKQVETLINEFQTPGYHSVNWNADNLPTGVYLIRMDSGDFTKTQKVLLVK